MSKMIRFLTLAFVCGIGQSGVSQAAEPALQVKVQSVKQLLGKAEYIGALFGQEEAAKQFKEFVENLGKSEKGFEGIDIDKPVGLYAFVEKDIEKSRIMLLIPVKDKDAVLDLMQQRANLDPKAEDGDYYSVELPDFPAPVYFRFSDGYLHATLQNRDAMLPKMMLKPAQFFATKMTSMASIVARIDEVPMDIRKTVLGQIEFQANERAQQTNEPGTIEGKSAEFSMNLGLAALKQMMMEGKKLEVNFNIKPTSDELNLDVTFDAIADSDLKKTIMGWQNRSSVAGRLSVPENPLLLEQGNFALGATSQKEWANLVDQVIEKVLEDAKDGGERVVAKMALEALAPTLKSGVLDFGVVGTQQEAGLNGVLALRVVQGNEIAKTVQTFSAFADKKDAEFKFKIEEINGITLHKVTIKEPEFAAVTGTKFVWLGTSDDVLLVSIEEKGEAIRKAAKGDAASAPITKSVLSVARLMSSGPGIDPEGEFKGAKLATYGETGVKGDDTIAFSATGGEKLTLNLTMKGKLLRFFYEVDQIKKNQ